MWFDRLGVAALLTLTVTAGAAAQVAYRQSARPASPNVLTRPARLDLSDAPLLTALRTLSERAGVAVAFSADVIGGREHRVTCACAALTVGEALDRMLSGTGFDHRAVGNQVVVFPSPDANAATPGSPAFERAPSAARGGVLAGARIVADAWLTRIRAAAAAEVVAGIVVDAKTGLPIEGAQIVIEGTTRGVVTDAAGRFRIDGVSGTEVTVRVVVIGYRGATRSVRVGDERIRIALDETAIALDRVVVTGTAFPAKVRSLPNPINLITASEIQAKAPTNVTDLLRGEIPGVMALSGGQDDYASYIYVRGNMGSLSQDVIKIYLDGVELANPQFLSTLDPKSIERIEVVRGPQSSAIYGSEAASGVLQIFTKKGTPGLSGPRLEVQAAAGVIESTYTPAGAGTPQTRDYSLGVSGGGESFSYRAGAAYATVGEWVKHYGSKTLNLSGGFRAVQGPLTAELTALWSDRDYDFGNSPLYLRFPAGACDQCGNPDYHNNYEYALSQNTMALTLGWQAAPQWRHTLTLGDDQNRVAYHQPRPSFNTPADTFVLLSNQEYRRRQVRYHTAYEGRLGEAVTARWTVGADYWSYDLQGGRATNLLNAFGTIRTSAQTSYTVTNDGWWNAGYFGMAELGFGERFYATLAGRVEDNPNLGEEYGRAFVPRVGAAWVHALGAADMKLRAQWGRGVRPPLPVARAGRVEPTFVYLPNPAIAPEEKAGWDAGVDVHWGSRASFSLTRYDEEARNLIYLETIDATSIPRLRQYRNIGAVDMKGWEAEGNLTLGRLRLAANYAYADNVVTKVDAATAANPDASVQVGDRTGWVPKHSGGGRVTARVGGGSVSVDASVMAGWRSLDFDAFLGSIYAGEPPRATFRDYFVEYPALWKWNLRAERAVGQSWQTFLRVENLMDNQGADLGNSNVTPGRTTVLGVRWAH